MSTGAYERTAWSLSLWLCVKTATHSVRQAASPMLTPPLVSRNTPRLRNTSSPTSSSCPKLKRTPSSAMNDEPQRLNSRSAIIRRYGIAKSTTTLMGSLSNASQSRCRARCRCVGRTSAALGS